jgi:hypothetical protein
MKKLSRQDSTSKYRFDQDNNYSEVAMTARFLYQASEELRKSVTH